MADSKTSVKNELIEIHSDTDVLVVKAEQQAGVSSELLYEISEFKYDVAVALADYSSITVEAINELRSEFKRLNQELLAAVESATILLHEGQLTQIKTIKDVGEDITGSNIVGGILGGMFAMAGSAVAARHVSNTIKSAANSRPLTDSQQKEISLIKHIFQLEQSFSYLTFDQIMDSASDKNSGILLKVDTRRILNQLIDEDILERYEFQQIHALRLVQAHSKVKNLLEITEEDDKTLDESEIDMSKKRFLYLGKELGITLSSDTAQLIEYVQVNKTYSAYNIAIRLPENHPGPSWIYSKEIGSEKLADELFETVQQKIADFVAEGE